MNLHGTTVTQHSWNQPQVSSAYLPGPIAPSIQLTSCGRSTVRALCGSLTVLRCAENAVLVRRVELFDPDALDTIVVPTVAQHTLMVAV